MFYGVWSNVGLNGAKKRVEKTSDDIVAKLNDATLSEEQKVQIIDEYVMSEGIFVFIFDGQGNSLLEDVHFKDEMVAEIYAAVKENAPLWEKDRVYGFTTRNDKRAVYNVVTCVEYGGEQAMFTVRFPVGSVAASVMSVQLVLIAIALGAVFIAFFISYSLAKKLSSPLKEISVTAKKLAGGDYTVQFNSAQYAEIATLSDSLNNMKDEMKKSDDFQKELIANVSHDLRTPLTMIKAYASMIKEISGDDKGKREKHLQVIIDESDRLTGLVNDILSTSKIQSGLQQLNVKVFNLTELLYSVINKFSYLQETQGYSIMVDVDSNLYTSGDEEKIYQVVYNLVSNAINYTGADKTVFISLKYEPESGLIKFAVRDTGKGIKQEEIAHIWDRYYRSKDSHSRPVKGTGLGLNIVKIILQRHKFKYGVDSTEGVGSTFFVYFPYIPSTPEELRVEE